MNDPKWFLPFCVSRTSLASFMIFDLLFYFVVLFEIVLTLYIYIYICILFRYVNFTNAIVFQSFNCFQLRKGLSSNHREFNKVILRAVFHIVLLRCRLMHIYICIQANAHLRPFRFITCAYVLYIYFLWNVLYHVFVNSVFRCYSSICYVKQNCVIITSIILLSVLSICYLI